MQQRLTGGARDKPNPKPDHHQAKGAQKKKLQGETRAVPGRVMRCQLGQRPVCSYTERERARRRERRREKVERLELRTSNIRNPDQNISNTLFHSRRSSNCVTTTVSRILELKGRMEERLEATLLYIRST